MRHGSVSVRRHCPCMVRCAGALGGYGKKSRAPSTGYRPVPHAQKKAPPVERISKWPESKDVAEGRAAMREVPVLALGGPQAAAIVPG